MKENIEVDCTKIKNFYSSKKHHTQSEKTSPRQGEDNYNMSTGGEFVSRIHKELPQINQTRINYLIF